MNDKQYREWCLNKWSIEVSMQSFCTPELYQQVIMSLDAMRK